MDGCISFFRQLQHQQGTDEVGGDDSFASAAWTTIACMTFVALAVVPKRALIRIEKRNTAIHRVRIVRVQALLMSGRLAHAWHTQSFVRCLSVCLFV